MPFDQSSPSALVTGAAVRHNEWGVGVVLFAKHLLPSRPPLYRCRFEWQWGHRVRWCAAEELAVVPSTPVARPTLSVVEHHPSAA